MPEEDRSQVDERLVMSPEEKSEEDFDEQDFLNEMAEELLDGDYEEVERQLSDRGYSIDDLPL